MTSSKFTDFLTTSPLSAFSRNLPLLGQFFQDPPSTTVVKNESSLMEEATSCNLEARSFAHLCK